MIEFNENYYENITEFCNEVKMMLFPLEYQRKKKGGYYVYCVPCAFDIETSSFYENGEKKSIMYIWQFCINGIVCIGRDWKSFLRLLGGLKKVLSLSENRRLYVYIHNLSYEFQFIRKWLEWVEVFSTDVRKPIKALCTYGIEFRDSYILSAYSLEMTAKQLHTYKVDKKVGYLDYDVLRNSKTPLTRDEILYCIYDVFVVVAYIQENIDEYGKITKIPLTNTGRVRDFCRSKCLKSNESGKYKGLMATLTLTPKEYQIWRASYQGGFTHGNPFHINDVCTDVSSYDFTSSYPYVLISEKYPMGKGFEVDIKSIDDLDFYSDNFILVFGLRVTGVKPKVLFDNIISLSKCTECENYILNNGRVVYADSLTTVCTNIDFEMYLRFYEFETIEIGDCYCYAKDYLPKPLIESILSLYKMKTELKGVDGKEREYMHSKQMLNSVYGMMVTDIVRDDINYTDDWNVSKADLLYNIEKYNGNKNRFLFYPWGCMVTSYARRNLFTAILECGNDYIYSDTDSVKILNNVSHETYFNRYNEEAVKKLDSCMDYYNLPHRLYKPKTIKGVEKPLGVWDYEGDYKRFKTLGAKRYIYTDEKDGIESLHCTVAGVSKKGLPKYFHDIYGNDYKRIFNEFNDCLYIPKDYCGKLTHTYIDDGIEGEISDYMGNVSHYEEKSFVHLSKSDYELSMARSFIDYIRNVRLNREI